MWEAISYVTSALTLVAFVAAIIAAAWRQTLLRDERLIKTADSADKAKLVAQLLEFTQIDASGLTREQQYNIAIEQIQSRANRYKIAAKVVTLVALLCACVLALALTQKVQDTRLPASKETINVDRSGNSWFAIDCRDIKSLPLEFTWIRSDRHTLHLLCGPCADSHHPFESHKNSAVLRRHLNQARATALAPTDNPSPISNDYLCFLSPSYPKGQRPKTIEVVSTYKILVFLLAIDSGVAHRPQDFAWVPLQDFGTNVSATNRADTGHEVQFEALIYLAMIFPLDDSEHQRIDNLAFDKLCTLTW